MTDGSPDKKKQNRWWVDLIDRIYLALLGQPMTPRARQFLNHLSFTILGGSLAAAIIFPTNILAGRWLGPVQYGKYGLVVALANMWVIPMTLGIHMAANYYISSSTREEDRPLYFSTSFLFTTLLVIVTLGILYPLGSLVAPLLDASLFWYNFSLFFAVFLSLRSLSMQFLKGYMYFGLHAVLHVLEGATLAIVFFSVTLIGHIYSIEYYLYGWVLAYLLVSLVALAALLPDFQWTLVKKRELLIYSSLAVPAWIGGIVLQSLDRVFVSKYIGDRELGIYLAYSMVALTLLIHFATLVQNVMFSYASASENKEHMLVKLNRLATISFLPVIIGTCLLNGLVLYLFGREYGFDFWLVIEFSIFGFFKSYIYLAWWLIAAHGVRGVKFISVHTTVMAALFVAFTFAFLQQLNLYILVANLIGVQLYGLVVANWFFGGWSEGTRNAKSPFPPLSEKGN